MKEREVMTLETVAIEEMTLDYGIKAIDVYLDACNMYKLKMREKYLKTGFRDFIDYDHMIDMFMMIFENGISKFRFFYADQLAESFLYCYYMELKKNNLHNREVNRILDILAFNGSGESEAYSKIANDKIARDK